MKLTFEPVVYSDMPRHLEPIAEQEGCLENDHVDSLVRNLLKLTPNDDSRLVQGRPGPADAPRSGWKDGVGGWASLDPGLEAKGCISLS